MISITKHSDYSIVMLAHLARKPNAVVSAKELAEGSKLPYPTVSKLLKLLVKSGILMSIQGSHGGYRLKKSPTEISVASVIEAIEGPISMTECATGDHGKCKTQDSCSIQPHWMTINGVIKKSLESLAISSLSQVVPERRILQQLPISQG